MSDVLTFKKQSQFQQAVVEGIVQRIYAKKAGIFRLAISGGSTPAPIYEQLARQDIDWNRVELYLTDDRFVPAESNDSNRKMIERALLSRLPQPPLKWVYFDTSLPMGETLQKYERQLDRSEANFFDLVLLGLGADGHTASLFPDTSQQQLGAALTAHTSTEQHPVRDRLTLTYKAIENTREIFFLIAGESKKSVFSELQNNSKKSTGYPATRFFSLEKTTVFFSEV